MGLGWVPPGYRGLVLGLQFHLSERIRGRTPEGQVCAVLGDLSPRTGLMAIGRQPSPPLQGRNCHKVCVNEWTSEAELGRTSRICCSV